MRRALGVLFALALVVLTAPAASARSWSHDDPTGDVVKCFNPADSCDPASDEADADITRAQLNHNRRFVQLSMTMSDSDRTLDNDYVFEVQNGRHQTRLVEVNTYPRFGKPDGVLRVLDKKSFRPVRCRGAKGFHINWTSHVTAVTLPRTCFGNPKILRVRASGGWGEAHGNYYYIDSATTTQPPTEASLGPWSTWIMRG